jgi:hypothetical protein
VKKHFPPGFNIVSPGLVATLFVGFASITSCNSAERHAVVDALDDQGVLAKIATESMDEKVRSDAAGRIQSLALLERVAHQQLLTKYDHMGVIIALRRLLYETGFSDRLGPVQIKMSWKSFPGNFSWTKRGPDGFSKKVSVNIEKLTIAVLRKTTIISEASWNISGRYEESWSSDIDIGTIPAPIAFCDLLPGLWSVGLGNGHGVRPPSDDEISALGSIKNDRFYGGVEFVPERVVAAKSENQGILGWLYCHHNESSQYVAAVNRLTDQSVLAFTALDMTVPSFQGASPVAGNFCNSEMNEHRSMISENKAWSRITDQEILNRIAFQDPGEYVRSAAIQTLSDRTILRKVADEAPHDSDRKQAALRLKSLP